MNTHEGFKVLCSYGWKTLIFVGLMMFLIAQFPQPPDGAQMLNTKYSAVHAGIGFNAFQKTDYVEIINLSGVVDTTWITQLKTVLQENDCKLVIANINSGGGSVSTSMFVTHEFVRLQKYYNKPIVIYSDDGIFSGAYMVATSGVLIGISPGAMTGSIGVFWLYADYSEAYKKQGVAFDIIRSGKNKISTAPFNKMTIEQRAVIQDLVNESFNDFIDIILEYRFVSIKTALFSKGEVPYYTVKDSLKTLCDGRPYSPLTAYNYGLVDIVCYLDDFVAVTYKCLNLDDNMLIKCGDVYYSVHSFAIE